jgi:hypothetical protein
MTFEIPDEVAKSVRQLSKASGKTTEQLVVAALRAHFPPMPEALRDEMIAWDLASEKDIESFNAKHGL